jgi:hypothetical protein
MEYKLTCNVRHAHYCSDGKRRNMQQYYLNNILLLEHKLPFEPKYGKHYCTDIDNVYLLNGSIYQTRIDDSTKKVRNVRFPVSKKVLSQFNIPKDLKIDLAI